MSNLTARTEKLDLRVSVDAKQALKRAAAASQQSVSEFVLSSALVKAEEVLAEQTMVSLSDIDWAAFLAALDAPPAPPHLRLASLLSEPSVFDR
jgi:uncharacterized protein (DUF1778 family)